MAENPTALPRPRVRGSRSNDRVPSPFAQVGVCTVGWLFAAAVAGFQADQSPRAADIDSLNAESLGEPNHAEFSGGTEIPADVYGRVVYRW